MEELKPVPVTVEIVNTIKLLIVFADGAKIFFDSGGFQFTANFCDSSIFNPLGTLEEARKILYPGRKMQIYLELDETAKGHYSKKTAGYEGKEISEIGELDWILKGKILSKPFEERVLIDAGVPVLAFWNGGEVVEGEYGEWSGELKAWLSD